MKEICCHDCNIKGGTMKRFKASEKLIKSLVPYWKRAMSLEAQHNLALARLESEMFEVFKKDFIFFRVAGERVGIGTEDRKMKLIPAVEFRALIGKKEITVIDKLKVDKVSMHSDGTVSVEGLIKKSRKEKNK